MTYATGQSLILTRVQACDVFDTTNTSECDWKVLNSGKSNTYAILRPGAFKREWLSATMYRMNYTTVIEVWQRYTVEGTSYTNLYTGVNALMAMESYHRMGDTTNAIEDFTIEGSDDPEEMWTKQGGVMWLRWKMRVRWYEETTVTYAE